MKNDERIVFTHSLIGSAKMLRGRGLAGLFWGLSMLFVFFADTRVVLADGVFWNEEELEIWQQRAESGPYKSYGDAFPRSPGEWDRIETNAQVFFADPTADRVREGSQFVVYEVFASNAEIGNHILMLDAAMYALVKEREELKERVIDELMWHASRSYLQAPADFVYQPNRKVDNNNWFKGEYFARICVIYDLVGDSMSAAEREAVRAWLVPWAYVIDTIVHEELANEAFPNRLDRDYSVLRGRAAQAMLSDEYTHQDSSGSRHNRIAALHRIYNNRKFSCVQFVGFAGALFDDSVLMDRAKLFIEEWLKYSVFPDGGVGEAQRNDIKNVRRGSLLYNASNLHAAVTVAFALARTGDSSLFEYSTRDGRWGTASGSGEDAKSLKLVVDAHFDLMEYQVDHYYYGVDLSNPPSGNAEDYRIDKVRENGQQWNNELYFAPIGNRYWDDQRIEDGYTRRSPNSVPYGENMSLNSYGTRLTQGNAAQFPSLIFMYGELGEASFAGEAPRQRLSGGVSWFGEAGVQYSVLYSDDGWQTVDESTPIDGAGRMIEWIDESSSGGSFAKREYRVRVN